MLGDGADMSSLHVNLHKRVVNRDHKDLASVLQRGVVDVTGHVGAGACRACGLKDHSSATGTGTRTAVYRGCERIWKRTEGSRDADDNAFTLEFLGDVDLVAGRGLDELNAGDGIAHLDIEASRGLEATSCTWKR